MVVAYESTDYESQTTTLFLHSWKTCERKSFSCTRSIFLVATERVGTKDGLQSSEGVRRVRALK